MLLITTHKTLLFFITPQNPRRENKMFTLEWIDWNLCFKLIAAIGAILGFLTNAGLQAYRYGKTPPNTEEEICDFFYITFLSTVLSVLLGGLLIFISPILILGILTTIPFYHLGRQHRLSESVYKKIK